MTITTEELQRLVDEATEDATFNFGLSEMATEFGGTSDHYDDRAQECLRTAYLAKRVLAAEKMAEHFRGIEAEVRHLQEGAYQDRAVWETWDEFFEGEDTHKKIDTALTAYEETK